MKKRFIACLSLLLLLCLLLSSCAPGLPGHALLTSLQSGIGGFTSNLTNLLQDNLPVVIDGSSDYAIVRNVNASDQVKSAISYFCDAVYEKSGFDFAIAKSKLATHRILIGDTGEAASNDAKVNLNAANFYIGLSGKDIVVQATNDMMLAAALRYLTEQYVLHEEANVAPGAFFLPNDLSFTAPTLLCEGGDYNIIRSERASERAIASIARLHEVISTTAGVRISLKSDMMQNADPTAKEILIGAPNREECKEILASLQYNEYYIGTVGNRIMILANNEPMLELAVEEFLATFVCAQDAQFDAKEKNISLPAYCARRYTANTKLLAQAGLSNVILVHPEGASERVLSAVNMLKESFHALTNATLPVVSDKQYKESVEGKIEILLGATNRKESTTALKQLKPGEWRIYFENNTLLVAAKDDISLLLALQSLAQWTAQQISALSNSPVFDWDGSPVTGIPRLLYFPANLRLGDIGAPEVPSFTDWLKLADSSYLIYRQNCQQTAYNSYLSTLEEAGYTQKTNTVIGQVLSTVHHSPELIITVTYNKADKTLRVVTDKRNEVALPQLPEELNERTDIDPFYAQLDGIYNRTNAGSLHVMRLCNGTFVVINGGHGGADEARTLLSFLQRHNQLKGLPIISCWLLSDTLSSTVATFTSFAEQLAGQVHLQSVIYSPICDDQTASGVAAQYGWRTSALQVRISRFGDNVRVYKARTGMRYCFAGCEIEALLTPEDLPVGQRISSSRDASCVFRVQLAKGNDDKQSILLLSHLSKNTAPLLIKRYGKALKSDVVQCPSTNDMSSATATELYALIAAPVVLWPAAKGVPNTNVKYYDDTSWNGVTRNMLKQSFAKVCYVACRGTEILTLSQLKAGANGKVYGNGLTALEAATGTCKTVHTPSM